MPKRGRRKKLKLKLNVRTETLRSVLSVVLLILSAMILVSFVASSYWLNAKIQEVLRLLFGYTHLILIPIFLIMGLLLINSITWRFVETRVLAGLVLFFISLMGLFHAVYPSNGYLKAKQGLGGGLIGFKLYFGLATIISNLGAVLLLLGVCVMSLILIFDISFDQILEKLAASSKAITKKLAFSKPALNLKFIAPSKTKTTKEETSKEDLLPSSPDVIEPSFEIIPTPSEPQTQSLEPQKSNPLNTQKTKTVTPNLPYSDKIWEFPPIDILKDTVQVAVDKNELKEKEEIIEATLNSFGIKAEVKETKVGPSVTQYALETESGTKTAKVVNLQYDLALALASPTGSVRIEAPIPGKSLVGIEVPNKNRAIINFKELLLSDKMKGMKSKLAIVLGVDVGGAAFAYDLAKMPHLLVAGTTGSGKSIFLHSLIFSILFRASPQECKFILIDPKRVELKYYDGAPHLLTPVVTDTDQAPKVFKWAVVEMERRYNLLETAKVRNIEDYNEKSGFQAMPYIVIIVDELAEIMVTDPAAVEKSIIRIAQMARAVGIHLVLALQRPSANIITGLIKANVPCRIAFNVASQVDSRVIIDQPGAEKLLGKGDMLFIPPDDSKPRRLQGAYISPEEITALVSFLKAQGVEPDYKTEIFELKDNLGQRSISAGGEVVDDLFDEALDIVVNEGKASASHLQRRLAIGYTRAARILDEMEKKGYVGPLKGGKGREIHFVDDKPGTDSRNLSDKIDFDN